MGRYEFELQWTRTFININKSNTWSQMNPVVKLDMQCKISTIKMINTHALGATTGTLEESNFKY